MKIVLLIVGFFVLCCLTSDAPGDNTIGAVDHGFIDQTKESETASTVCCEDYMDIQEKLKQVIQNATKMEAMMEEMKKKIEKQKELETTLKQLIQNVSNMEAEEMTRREQQEELTASMEGSGQDNPRTPSDIQLPYKGHPARNEELNMIVPFVNESAIHHLLKLLVQPSCYKWKESGFSQSGYYMIDPDGPAMGQRAFRVYCDMVTGFTFVQHEDGSDKLQQVEKCSGAGCYKKRIKYKAEQEQMLALIEISESCQQNIKLECRQTPLTKNDKLLSWWVDRHHNVQRYWSGDTDNHTCTCGFTRACVNPKHVCNCNVELGNVTVSDEGYITKTNVLPVTELNFGDTMGDDKELRYQLGPLRCYGAKSPGVPSSCLDVFMNGHTNNGYYIVGEEEDLKVQFCNIKKFVDEGWNAEGINARAAQMYLSSIVKDVTSNINSIHGDLKDVRSQLNIADSDLELLRNPVIFNAFRSSSKDDHESYVVFDKVTINRGGGYNATTGIFTAPVSGVYLFSTNSDKQESLNTRVTVRKNGNSLTWGYSHRNVYRNTFGNTVLTNATRGDEVGVYLDYGKLYAFSAAEHSGSALFFGILLYK